MFSVHVFVNSQGWKIKFLPKFMHLIDCHKYLLFVLVRDCVFVFILSVIATWSVIGIVIGIVARLNFSEAHQPNFECLKPYCRRSVAQASSQISRHIY